jgi:hypothetical protein
MGAVDPQVSIPTTVNSINSEPLVRNSKLHPKMHLHTNAWRLIDSEFDSLNALFSFTLEACCDLDGTRKKRKKVFTTPVKMAHNAKHVLWVVLSARLFWGTMSPSPL